MIFFKSSFFSIERNRCWVVGHKFSLRWWIDSLLVRIDSRGERPVFPYLSSPSLHLNIFIIKGSQIFHYKRFLFSKCQGSWLQTYNRVNNRTEIRTYLGNLRITPFCISHRPWLLFLRVIINSFMAISSNQSQPRERKVDFLLLEEWHSTGHWVF